MKNIMSMTESLDQVMQLEVAVPLTVGICMLMYTCFFLFTYNEKSSGGKASAKKLAARPSKPTRRSVRETKAPKVWGDEDEPKVRRIQSLRLHMELLILDLIIQIIDV